MANILSIEGLVREANQGDLDALQTLDEACFELPWETPDFESALASRGAQVLLVVEHEGALIGYAVYTVLPQRDICQLLRIGVRGEFRRRQIATQLLAYIQLGLHAKLKFRVCVQEEDIVSQIFLKKNGLTCTQILKRYFRYTGNVFGNAFEFVQGGVPMMPAPKPRTGVRLGKLEVNLKNRVSRRKKGYEDVDL